MPSSQSGTVPDQCIAIKKDTQEGEVIGLAQNNAFITLHYCLMVPVGWVLGVDGGIWRVLLKLDSAEHLTPVHSCADNKFMRNVTYLN
jgi:hypothetical protein